MTGHEDDAKDDTTAIDWERLATAVDTLVVLMGARSLPRIAREPVAVVRWGTTTAQESVLLTLGEAALLGDAPLPPPVVVVIGDVVRLGPALQRTCARLDVDALGYADVNA